MRNYKPSQEQKIAASEIKIRINDIFDYSGASRREISEYLAPAWDVSSKVSWCFIRELADSGLLLRLPKYVHTRGYGSQNLSLHEQRIADVAAFGSITGERYKRQFAPLQTLHPIFVFRDSALMPYSSFLSHAQNMDELHKHINSAQRRIA